MATNSTCDVQWCDEGSRPHRTHRHVATKLLLSDFQFVALSVVQPADERLIEMYGTRYQMADARILGGSLLDLVRRFG